MSKRKWSIKLSSRVPCKPTSGRKRTSTRKADARKLRERDYVFVLQSEIDQMSLITPLRKRFCQIAIVWCVKWERITHKSFIPWDCDIPQLHNSYLTYELPQLDGNLTLTWSTNMMICMLDVGSLQMNNLLRIFLQEPGWANPCELTIEKDQTHAQTCSTPATKPDSSPEAFPSWRNT